VGELTAKRFPWEPVPVTETVAALQRDVAYMVTHTAVLVHSNQPALQMLVNTPRGQIVPRGACKFTDGSTVEFQDVGMPQPGAPAMTLKDLMARVWEIARELGLELE
jgi:peptidoglycan hydrolase-like protein with peptidoglycan-binding domain